MIFNVREQPEHLCNIIVVQKMKYLGIEIDNKYFSVLEEWYTLLSRFISNNKILLKYHVQIFTMVTALSLYK